MSLRIGTWNLECVVSRNRNADRQAFLQSKQADIWILTETHPDIALAGMHRISSKPRANTRNGMHWVDVWSSYDVTPVRVEDPVRCAAALVQSPLGPLVVFGTVWPWHSDVGEQPNDEVWTTWARQPVVVAQQRLEWTRLRQQFPDAWICVGGDLNMTFGGPNGYGARQGRVECATAMGELDLACATSWARTGGLLEASPIDHVLLPQPLFSKSRVVDAWPGRPHDPSGLSDHSGLIVEIEG